MLSIIRIVVICIPFASNLVKVIFTKVKIFGSQFERREKKKENEKVDNIIVTKYAI